MSDTGASTLISSSPSGSLGLETLEKKEANMKETSSPPERLIEEPLQDPASTSNVNAETPSPTPMSSSGGMISNINAKTGSDGVVISVSNAPSSQPSSSPMLGGLNSLIEEYVKNTGLLSRSPLKFPELVLVGTPQNVEGEARNLTDTILQAELPQCKVTYLPTGPRQDRYTKKYMKEHTGNLIKEYGLLFPTSTLVILDETAASMLGFPFSNLQDKVGNWAENYGPLCLYGYPTGQVVENLNLLWLVKTWVNTIKNHLTRTLPKVRHITSMPEIHHILTGRWPSIDIETTSLDPHKGEILCIGISSSHGIGYFVPGKIPMWDPTILNRGMVAHGAKFEAKWFVNKCAVKPPLHCSYLATWLVDENGKKGLKYHCTNTLGIPNYWSHIDRKANLAELPLDILGTYCALDAWAAGQLYQHQLSKLTHEQVRLLQDTLEPMSRLLASMELRGFHIDRGRLTDTIRDELQYLKGLGRVLNEKFPGLNVFSNPQMKVFLFDKLKLPAIKRTPKNGVSCDQLVLEYLDKKFPEAGLGSIVEFRKRYHKVKAEMVPMLQGSELTGRIHTNYNLGAVVTGRLSSSDPNLQNITKTSPVRPCMTSRHKRGKIIQYDYKGHEFVVWATVANSVQALELLEQGRDVHDFLVNILHNASGLVISRPKAKEVNFSLIYGVGVPKLAKILGVSRQVAKMIWETWHSLYPEAVKFHEKIREQVNQLGYVENIFGRRRHLTLTGVHEEKQAYNFPIQSVAVEICYSGMLRASEAIIKNGAQNNIVLIGQVHDSVVLDTDMEVFDKEWDKMLSKCLTEPPILNGKPKFYLSVEKSVKDHF